MESEEHVLKDLAHQMRPPLMMAIARSNSLLQQEQLDVSVKKQLQAIRALCHKANRVARSLRLLSPRIDLKPVKIGKKRLLEILLECAQDNEVLLSPDRHVKIVVDQSSFEDIGVLVADAELLEQAFNNLLDNAAKYSYSNTVVSVKAQRKEKTLYLTFTNSGITLRPEDVPKVVERGWRSPQAMLVTSEGAGLGLWFVHRIMNAHAGSVLISPSDASGRTQVRLGFPASEALS